MVKRITGLLMVLLMMLALFACAPNAAESPDDSQSQAPEESSEPQESSAQDPGQEDATKPRIGFALMDNSIPWAVAYADNVFGEAEARGYEYIYTDAQLDTAKQISDVEDLLAQGIDLLVVTPIEQEASVACVEAAKEAGVPVVLTGRYVNAEPGVDYITCIASDQYWIGQQACKKLAEITGGKARIVEITGTVGSTSAIDRSKGFYDALEDYPEMEIVASQTGDFLRVNAQKVMENLLQSLGNDGFDAVFSQCDDMTIGANMVLKSAGLKPGTDIKVVSIDGLKEAVQLIIDGEINALVTSGANYGTILFDTIEKYLAGEEIPGFITYPDVVIDPSNAEEELPLAP